MKYQKDIMSNKSAELSNSHDNITLNNDSQISSIQHQSIGRYLLNKLITKLENSKKEFMFNTVIRVGFEAFIDVLFASVFNLKYMTFKNSTDVYSGIVAIIWLVLMSILYWLVFIVFLVTRPGYSDEKAEHSRYGVLLKDLKSSSTGSYISNCYFLKKFNLCLFDNVIFLSRRILIIFVVLFISDNGLLQLSIVIASCIFIVTMKLLVRPYQVVTKNIQDVMSEFVLIWIAWIFTKFNSESSKFATNGLNVILGKIWIVLILWIVVCHYIWIVISAIFLFRVKCKSSKLNKKKIPGKIFIEQIKND